MSNEMNNVGPMIEKITHRVGNNIGTMAGEVSGQTAKYIKTSRGYVEENPLQSLAIAAATGLVLGSLLTILLRRRA